MGVSKRTLQQWKSSGKFTAHVDECGIEFFYTKELLAVPEVKEMIDEAIERGGKKGLFGKVRKSRLDEFGHLILLEKDFEV